MYPVYYSEVGNPAFLIYYTLDKVPEGRLYLPPYSPVLIRLPLDNIKTISLLTINTTVTVLTVDNALQ